MRRLVTYFLLVLLFGFSGVYAQTAKVLTYDDFNQRVRQHHPLAQRAALRVNQAQSMLRMARGGFDPKVSAGINAKDFDDKSYYDIRSIGLKIPTWSGISVQGGFDENRGQFLNPEKSTPGNGLGYAGVSVTLGRGLFMDERRAALRKAQIAQGINEAERQLILNDLLLSAGVAYWDWFAANNALRVQQEAVVAAQDRFNAVKRSAILGDIPMIDTVEAVIQLQNRTIGLQQAQLDELNAIAYLQVFLWNDGLIPLELDSNTVPPAINTLSVSFPSVVAMQDSLIRNHPVLMKGSGQVEQLSIERRWKAEQLKPMLDLKYNALTERVGNEIAGFNQNDRTWGVDFEMPLFLRKERGSLELARLKVQDKTLELNDKRQHISAKFQQAINQWQTSAEQYTTYRRTVQDTRTLLDGERRLFNGGESSLFMVNSRELSYISAQLKAISFLSKNQMAAIKTRHALGTLN